MTDSWFKDCIFTSLKPSPVQNRVHRLVEYTKTMFLKSLAPAVLAITVGTASFAALPPSAYQAWQKEAPEYLSIQVRSVKTTETQKPDWVEVAVSLQAQVKQIRRSRSRLKAGDVITIRYERRTHKGPWAGPAPVPLLVKGQDYPAYLKKVQKGYEPAAGAYSFSELTLTTNPVPKVRSGKPVKIQLKTEAAGSNVKKNSSGAQQLAALKSMQFSNITHPLGEVVDGSANSKGKIVPASQNELDSALSALKNRANFLQDRSATLELNQFSPTTKIQGQAIITIEGGEFR